MSYDDGTYPEDLMPRCTACEEPFSRLRAGFCPECFGDREEGLQTWLLDQCQQAGFDADIYRAMEADGVWTVSGVLCRDGRAFAEVTALVFPGEPATFIVDVRGSKGTGRNLQLTIEDAVALRAEEQAKAARLAERQREAERLRAAAIRSHAARFESALPRYLRSAP